MKIDLGELKYKAERSNVGESYEIIDKNEEYQLRARKVNKVSDQS
jgi:hypothetical protein